MKIQTLLLITLFSVFGFSSCKDKSANQETEPKLLKLSAQQAEFISESNSFGINLFSEVAKSSSNNMMLSPLSASVALSMLMNGADGNTRAQIQEMLGYSSSMNIDDVNSAYNDLKDQLLSADKRVNFALANAMFYRNNFAAKESFIQALNKSYSAEVKGLDFSKTSAINTINDWASDNTKGKVKKVINQISPDAVMFILNALYFKGNWSAEFEKSETSDKKFYFTPDSYEMVPTMFGEVNVRTTSNTSFTAIELPYGRKNFTMIILLPKTSISDLMADLNSQTWLQTTADLSSQDYWGTVDMYLPKFKFSYEKILNDELKELGMTDAFSGNADLTGIHDSANLRVSFVKQNTFIETNEEGSEAAAVTTIGIELTSTGPPQNPIIRVDKPFVFAIREQTSNSLLFIGKIENPLN